MGLTSTCPKFWSHSPRIIHSTTFLMITTCIYSGAHWLLHPILDLRLSNMYNICLDPERSHKHSLLLEMTILGLPLIAVTSATPVLDAVTYRFVSAWVTKRQFFTKTDEKMNIPMRTMIITLIFTLNVFIGCLIVFFGAHAFSATTWKTIVFVIGNLINALRNPMICLFSHRVNSENRRHRSQRREENRLREIQAAKRSREMRKRQRVLFIDQSTDASKYVSQSVQTEIW